MRRNYTRTYIQERSHEFAMGEQGVWGRKSPAGFRGRAPVGGDKMDVDSTVMMKNT